MYFNSFTLHGHRGCRGLLPENTIPAFQKAVDLGCHYLEIDVVITKDNQVLVSHEPWLNHEICLSPDGKKLTVENEKQYNLYEMTYEQIRRLDCGSIGHPRFPQQQAMRTCKPLLSEMIDNIEAYTKSKGLLPVGYNIEVKRVVEDDHVFHPDGELFSKLIIDILKDKKVIDRAIFQTFDLECMEIAHRVAPDLTLSFLVDNEETAEQNINKLSFVPPIYGPWFKQIDSEMILYCNKNNIKVIPWTVNELHDIQDMIDIGVSGLISDYPDRVQQVLKSI